VTHHTQWHLLAITHSVTNPSFNLITAPLLRKSAVCSPKTGSFVSSSSSFNFTWLSIGRLINLFSLSTPLLMSEESLILAAQAFVLYGYVAGFGSVNLRGGRGAVVAGFLLTAFNVSFRGSFSRIWNKSNPVRKGLQSTTRNTGNQKSARKCTHYMYNKSVQFWQKALPVLSWHR